jgi:hypothetical protein
MNIYYYTTNGPKNCESNKLKWSAKRQRSEGGGNRDDLSQKRETSLIDRLLHCAA